MLARNEWAQLRTAEAISAEIKERLAVIKTLTGWLYTGIMWDEVDDLEKLLKDMPPKG